MRLFKHAIASVYIALEARRYLTPQYIRDEMGVLGRVS